MIQQVLIVKDEDDRNQGSVQSNACGKDRKKFIRICPEAVIGAKYIRVAKEDVDTVSIKTKQEYLSSVYK
jgi:translation initiation factor IF-1